MPRCACKWCDDREVYIYIYIYIYIYKGLRPFHSTALNSTGTRSRGRRKPHVDMFFSEGFGPLTTSKNIMSTCSEFPWNFQGETYFSIEELIRGYENCSRQASGPSISFRFLGVWRLCLYLWVPYNLGHALQTWFTVAVFLFWCFFSRLVLEANQRRKVLARGFLGGFFTFQGCATLGSLINLGSGGSTCIQTFFTTTLVVSDLEQQGVAPRIYRWFLYFWWLCLDCSVPYNLGMP